MYHILQECRTMDLPRTERHNFIARQAERIAYECNPEVRITCEKLLVSPSGAWLRPDIVAEEGNTVHIIDIVVAWDTNIAILKMWRHKQ